MKVINDGLSEIAYALMSYNGYIEDDKTEELKSKSYASVTSLLKDPKEFILSKRHSKSFKTNASDNLWLVFGTSVHDLLEKVLKNNDKYLLEQRMFLDVEGKIVSGKFDVYDKETGILYDLKTTSRAQIEKGEINKNTHWTQQLNIYAYMIKHTLNLPVKKIKIIWIDKYFSKGRLKYSDTPDLKPIGEITLPIWNDETTIKFITKRINNFKRNDHLPDVEIPLCSFDNRFMTEPKIAIYAKDNNFKKDGDLKKRTKASKLCSNVSELVYWLANKQFNKIAIEFRPSGEAVKCLEYCNCKNFCNGYTKAKLNIKSERFITDR